MLEFKLPDVAEGIHEAEILRWMVAPGEQVKLDQPMVEIQTDKSVAEIGAPVSGKVLEILAQPGTIARVGEVLVTLEPQGTQTAPKAASASARGGEPAQAGLAAQPPGASLGAASSGGTATASGEGGKRRALAAPAARKMAFEMGIDIDQVSGTGPGGRVTMEDVRTFAARAATPAPAVVATNGATRAVVAAAPALPAALAEPGGEQREPLVGLRRRIAERMELAWRTIPHATAFGEADGAALMALREELKPQAEKLGIHLTYLPLLVKIVVQALKEFPIFNASLDEEHREIIYKRFYHIGLATDTPDGLLISVVRDADRLTLLDLAREVNRLVEAGRARKLTLQESSGSTFTLNNVGSFGGSGSGVPIINPPEAAILAVGALRERPVARQGQIIARPTLPLSLSFDHRLIDGAGSSAFLARVQELVEHPSLLLLNSY
ncbi:MAG TPA: dihydrolipoamide acetyltransferase family protein [Ktedonobacterales bacterium]|nr:dihydrolipoamide acetyltransferase family protein [Ktedonobacterales bacterium]